MKASHVLAKFASEGKLPESVQHAMLVQWPHLADELIRSPHLADSVFAVLYPSQKLGPLKGRADSGRLSPGQAEIVVEAGESRKGLLEFVFRDFLLTPDQYVRLANAPAELRAEVCERVALPVDVLETFARNLDGPRAQWLVEADLSDTELVEAIVSSDSSRVHSRHVARVASHVLDRPSVWPELVSAVSAANSALAWRVVSALPLDEPTVMDLVSREIPSWVDTTSLLANFADNLSLSPTNRAAILDRIKMPEFPSKTSPVASVLPAGVSFSTSSPAEMGADDIDLLLGLSAATPLTTARMLQLSSLVSNPDLSEPQARKLVCVFHGNAGTHAEFTARHISWLAARFESIHAPSRSHRVTKPPATDCVAYWYTWAGSPPAPEFDEARCREMYDWASKKLLHQALQALYPRGMSDLTVALYHRFGDDAELWVTFFGLIEDMANQMLPEVCDTVIAICDH